MLDEKADEKVDLADGKETPDKEVVQANRQYPVSISETIGVNLNYQVLHYHDLMEVNMIRQGSGYYIINGVRHDFKKDDIILINANDVHCAYEDKDLVMYVLQFDKAWFSGLLLSEPKLLEPFTKSGISFSNKLDGDHEKMPYLKSLLLTVLDIHNEQPPFYKAIVFGYLLEFLIYVNNECKLEEDATLESRASSATLDKIKLVLSALAENPSYPWTVQEMAELVNLSPSHFSEIFRTVTGTTPVQHLIKIRLEKSCHLLRNTEESVIDIAMSSGFNTMSHFNKLFKRYFKKSPREFRESA